MAAYITASHMVSQCNTSTYRMSGI